MTVWRITGRIIKTTVIVNYISSSSACPELERSGFHEVLPVFSVLGASPSRVEAMIMRLEICSQGT